MIAARVARLVLLASLVPAAAAPARDRPFTVRFTPFELLPGQDRITCEYRELPNATALDVERLEIRSRPRIHHVTVFAYLGEDRDPQYLSNGRLRDGLLCWGIGPPDMHARETGLLGAVRPGPYVLPPGYAVTLLPRQPVAVVMHAFNRGRRARMTQVRLTVVPTDPATVRHHLEPLDALALWFELPPQQTTVHVADFVAPMDMNVAMLASHQHRYGTRVTVNLIVGDVDAGQVYENLNWREPRLQWLDPPIRLRAGDRLRVRCEWLNRSDETLRYGQAATDEMCNLNGYWFRDVEVPPEARSGIGAFLLPVTE